MKTQTKTVREWFEQLPEPYRSQAIANTSEEVLNRQKNNLLEALKKSFTWRNTKEGGDYWVNLYMELLKNKLESDKKNSKTTLEELLEKVTILTKEVSELKRLLIEKQEQPPIAEPDYLLTTKQAAKFLKLSPAAVYSKVSKGELPVMKRGKRTYFSYNELLKYDKKWKK